MTGISDTARLEAATETLAEYIGYLLSEIGSEQEKAAPNAERIAALEQERQTILTERRALTPKSVGIINRALYVYGPIVRALRG